MKIIREMFQIVARRKNAGDELVVWTVVGNPPDGASVAANDMGLAM